MPSKKLLTNMPTYIFNTLTVINIRLVCRNILYKAGVVNVDLTVAVPT